MRVIGIGGKKRAGKSTLASYITKACISRGWQVEEISFADPIKLMLAEVFKYEQPYATFTEDCRKQQKVEVAPGVSMTVRELLQKTGTDCFRDIIHTDFWMARGIARIKASSADVIIIPDVRFPNELEAINNLGMTIYIERPEYKVDGDTHASETALNDLKDDFDMKYMNWEDKKEELEAWARSIIIHS